MRYVGSCGWNPYPSVNSMLCSTRPASISPSSSATRNPAALTAGNTVDFKRLEDLPLVLPSSTPCWVRSRLTRNSAQAAKVVNPDLKRYVTLAHPKQGHFTQASRIVSRRVRETVEGWKGQLFAPAP